MKNTTQAEPMQPIVNFENQVFRFSHTKETIVRGHNGIKVVHEKIDLPIYRTIVKGKWKYASENKSLAVHKSLA